LFPASLPPGLPRNPNVLLIRTHPNPSPSVANSNKGSSCKGVSAWSSSIFLKALNCAAIYNRNEWAFSGENRHVAVNLQKTDSYEAILLMRGVALMYN
jgi:hypothetical protein